MLKGLTVSRNLSCAIAQAGEPARSFLDGHFLTSTVYAKCKTKCAINKLQVKGLLDVNLEQMSRNVCLCRSFIAINLFIVERLFIILLNGATFVRNEHLWT